MKPEKELSNKEDWKEGGKGESVRLMMVKLFATHHQSYGENLLEVSEFRRHGAAAFAIQQSGEQVN